MAQLIYSTITSLDGYIADESGNFDWSVPDEEVHAFINDLHRDVGTFLFGRRMYEVMVAWEGMDLDGQSQEMVDFAAVWHAADKVVYSKTIAEAATGRTRMESHFNPGSVRELKTAATRNLVIGGADLAGQGIKAGLVDEFHQFLSPIVVGGGTRALPDDIRWGLELVDERRFGNGVVFLRYRAT